MEGIDVSDDEQNNKEPGTRIDQQPEQGVDDSDESGESSGDETESADSENDREGVEGDIDEDVGTMGPESMATSLSNSVSSPSIVTARLGIFNAFKHNASSGDFFQSLGRRSEERTTVHGSDTHHEPFMLSPQAGPFEAPEIQQSEKDITGQQQQQQTLPSAETEHGATLDQGLQNDIPLQALPMTIPETEVTADRTVEDDTLRQAVLGANREAEATADLNSRDDTLPDTVPRESHEGSVESDRLLIETMQHVEAQDLIDEGVFYEAEKDDAGVDTSPVLPVAHQYQAEEEEKACRNDMIQESSVLADREDSSLLWKDDQLQNLESEIPTLEPTLSPPIEPYRVLRRHSSEEDFLDAISLPKTRLAENTALSSTVASNGTQGLRHQPVTAPKNRYRNMDQENSSSSSDSSGGGHLGYELLHPRFTSLKSHLAASSARVVSFSLLYRSDLASSPPRVASAETASAEKLSTRTGTKLEQQETSVMSSSTLSSSSHGMSTATTTATTATLATELGHLQTSVSSLHQRLDRIEQALDVSSRRRTDLGRRTVLGVVRMVVKQGVISAVIVLVVFVVMYRRRSPVAMFVMAHVQRQLRAAMSIDGTVLGGGGGGRVGTGSGSPSRWRTLMARLL
ncbi:hypothetical protein BGZ68_008002 [Mortierella alpina]|nr:hypothetical protein BGZ68_008002 [Mortierella alpina]